MRDMAVRKRKNPHSSISANENFTVIMRGAPMLARTASALSVTSQGFHAGPVGCRSPDPGFVCHELGEGHGSDVGALGPERRQIRADGLVGRYFKIVEPPGHG